MASPIKRQASIRVCVSDEMKARLDRLADSIGVPTSTLASVALGIYVTQQERTLHMAEAAIGKMVEGMTGEIGEQLKLMMQAEKDTKE